jgi:hypothetical protein
MSGNKSCCLDQTGNYLFPNFVECSFRSVLGVLTDEESALSDTESECSSPAEVCEDEGGRLILPGTHRYFQYQWRKAREEMRRQLLVKGYEDMNYTRFECGFQMSPRPSQSSCQLKPK